MKLSAEDSLLVQAFKYEGLLRALLWRLTRNQADVDELLQETYVRLLHRSTDGVRNIRGYVARAACHVASDWAQRRKVVPLELMADLSSLDVLSEAALTEDVINQHQEIERLVAAVKQLPLQMQQAFILSKVYGYSHQEIKARTRMSQRVLERRLTDAVRMVSNILGHDLSTPGYDKRHSRTGVRR